MKIFARLLLLGLIFLNISYAGVIEQKYFRGVSAMMDLRHNHALMQSKNVSPEDKIKVARDTYDITLNFRSQERAINGNDTAIEYGDRAMNDVEQVNGADAFVVLTMQTATNVLNANIDNFDIDYEIKKYSRGDFNEAQQEHFDICREVANQTLGNNTGSQDEEMVAEWLADHEFVKKGQDYFMHRSGHENMVAADMDDLSSQKKIKALKYDIFLKSAYGLLENISETDLYELYVMYNQLNELHLKKFDGLPLQSSLYQLKETKASDFYNTEYGKKFVDYYAQGPAVEELTIYSPILSKTIGKVRVARADNEITISHFDITDDAKINPELAGLDYFEFASPEQLNAVKFIAEQLGRNDIYEAIKEAKKEYQEVGLKVSNLELTEYRNSKEMKNFLDLQRESRQKFSDLLKQLSQEIRNRSKVYTLFRTVYDKLESYDKIPKEKQNRETAKKNYDTYNAVAAVVFSTYFYDLASDSKIKLFPGWHIDIESYNESKKTKGDKDENLSPMAYRLHNYLNLGRTQIYLANLFLSNLDRNKKLKLTEAPSKYDQNYRLYMGEYEHVNDTKIQFILKNTGKKFFLEIGTSYEIGLEFAPSVQTVQLRLMPHDMVDPFLF